MSNIIDRGCDPLGNGMFKMWPSGDVVDRKEKESRLSYIRQPYKNDCLGHSWEQIAQMQGGLNTLDITRK